MEIHSLGPTTLPWTPKNNQQHRARSSSPVLFHLNHLAMDQYLLIPFSGGWTSIYQLFWGSPGVQGFDTLPFSSKKTSNYLSSHASRRPMTPSVTGGVWRWDLFWTGWGSTNGFAEVFPKFSDKAISYNRYIYIYIMIHYMLIYIYMYLNIYIYILLLLFNRYIIISLRWISSFKTHVLCLHLRLREGKHPQGTSKCQQKRKQNPFTVSCHEFIRSDRSTRNSLI